MPTARQLRRMECVTRYPIYVLFSETVQGAASIRAYRVSHAFLHHCMQRVDNNQVFFFAYQAAVRSVSFHSPPLKSIFILRLFVCSVSFLVSLFVCLFVCCLFVSVQIAGNKDIGSLFYFPGTCVFLLKRNDNIQCKTRFRHCTALFSFVGCWCA